MNNINFLKSKLLYILVIFFLIFLSIFAYVQKNYTVENERNLVYAIKQETLTLIKLKQELTFNVAKTLSGNKKLIEVMKNGTYEKLYDDSFFPIAQKYKAFHNLALHVVDKDGINRYFSWTKKSVGKNILAIRSDLKELYKNPKQLMNISVGKFDMTFKGIVPIYDDNHNFLGIIESITHFNSISNELAEHNIYAASIIDKQFTQQLEHPFSKRFIDGYNISTLNLNKDVDTLLNKKGINFFISLKEYIYLAKDENFVDGFYILNIPIIGSFGQVVGYFVVFIDDIHQLKSSKIIINIIMTFMTLLFFLMTYLVYKMYRKNTLLVSTLNEQIKYETQKNLELIYRDSLTHTFTKEKFDVDKVKYSSIEIVMLNIKNFSQINETYGSKIGDDVLINVAQRLSSILNVDIYIE